MPSGIYDRGLSSASRRLQKLEALRKQIDEQISQAKENDLTRENARAQLLAFCKKNDIKRVDLTWVYNEIPPQVITRKMRAKRINEERLAKRRKRGAQYPPKPDLMPWGRQLRDIRQKGEMTATEVARAVGCHVSMINGWERGMWKLSKTQYAKLTDVLGKLPEYPTELRDK